MNKHILLVLKWLLNKESVTEEELLANRESAGAAYADAYVTDYADAYVTVAYFAADAVAHAAVAHAASSDADAYAYVSAYFVAYFAADAIAYADNEYYHHAIEKWLTEYFNITGEDRQEYFEALKEQG